MTNSSPNKVYRVIRSLIERRGRRGTWAYAAWLVAYLVTAWLFAGELAFHAGAGLFQMLPLLIPVLVVVVQIVYPTLLGWVVILIPSVLYCGAGVYFLVRNATRRRPQWEDDPAGFVMGSVFVGAYLAVCLCLILARPRRSTGIVGEGAPPNGGPAMPEGESGTTEGPPSVS